MHRLNLRSSLGALLLAPAASAAALAVAAGPAAAFTSHHRIAPSHSHRSIVSRSVPQGFVGVDMDPWEITRRGLDINTELDRAAAAGVEKIRFPLYWFNIQPYSSLARVPANLSSEFTADPAGGAPFNWTALDRFVGAAAARGIDVMPVVMGAPSWAADNRYGGRLYFAIPLDPNRFAAFTRDLAERYGTGGSFWTANPDIHTRGVTTWQIWNEPDLSVYWPQHEGESQRVRIGRRTVSSTSLGFAPTYLDLLRSSRRQILEADPQAKILLASFTNLASASLRKVYSSGGRGQFDAVGANIFTKAPSRLITAVKQLRAVMATNHDSALPYYVTEYSWSSGLGRLPLSVPLNFMLTNQTGQGKAAVAALSTFIANRSTLKIAGAYWHNWISPDAGSAVWDFAGMRRYSGSSGTDKPLISAFSRYVLGLQGCVAKTSATTCIK